MDRLTDTCSHSGALGSLARVVSDVFSPPMMAIPALILGVAASDQPGTYRFAILYFLLGIVGPVLYVVWLLKTGRVADFHLSDRRDRRGPFVVSLVFGAAALAVAYYFGAPTAFLGPICALQILTLLLFLITLVWQVSVHTATMAGVVTFACIALGTPAACFAWLVPLVAWARVYLRRHTVAQTLAGACLGASCFLVLYALRGRAW